MVPNIFDQIDEAPRLVGPSLVVSKEPITTYFVDFQAMLAKEVEKLCGENGSRIHTLCVKDDGAKILSNVSQGMLIR